MWSITDFTHTPTPKGPSSRKVLCQIPMKSGHHSTTLHLTGLEMEEAFMIATSRRKVPERTQGRWFFPVRITMVERERRYGYTPCLELKKWGAGDHNPTHRKLSSRGQKSPEGKEWQAGESRCLSLSHYVGGAAAFLENGRRACKKWSVRS